MDAAVFECRQNHWVSLNLSPLYSKEKEMRAVLGMRKRRTPLSRNLWVGCEGTAACTARFGSQYRQPNVDAVIGRFNSTSSQLCLELPKHFLNI